MSGEAGFVSVTPVSRTVHHRQWRARRRGGGESTGGIGSRGIRWGASRAGVNTEERRGRWTGSGLGRPAGAWRDRLAAAVLGAAHRHAISLLAGGCRCGPERIRRGYVSGDGEQRVACVCQRVHRVVGVGVLLGDRRQDLFYRGAAGDEVQPDCGVVRHCWRAGHHDGHLGGVRAGVPCAAAAHHLQHPLRRLGGVRTAGVLRREQYSTGAAHQQLAATLRDHRDSRGEGGGEGGSQRHAIPFA
eukprot:ctg_1316.g490